MKLTKAQEKRLPKETYLIGDKDIKYIREDIVAKELSIQKKEIKEKFIELVNKGTESLALINETLKLLK